MTKPSSREKDFKKCLHFEFSGHFMSSSGHYGSLVLRSVINLVRFFLNVIIFGIIKVLNICEFW